VENLSNGRSLNVEPLTELGNELISLPNLALRLATSVPSLQELRRQQKY